MQEVQCCIICCPPLKDRFISAGTAALDPVKSTTEQKLIRENQELRSIIGDLTIDVNEKSSFGRIVMTMTV